MFVIVVLVDLRTCTGGRGAGWRPIFLVNVPIGLAAMALANRTLPETRASDPIGVDLLGTELFDASLLALLVPLMEGQGLGWPPWCSVCRTPRLKTRI